MEVFVDLRPDEELAADWVPVRTVTEGVQAAPRVVATPTREMVSTYVDARHGHWPRDVDPSDSQQVARFKKRVERDDDYIRCVSRLGATLEDAIKLGCALPIYQDYFSGVPRPPDPRPPRMTPLAALAAPAGAGPTLRLCWRPDAEATGLGSLHVDRLAIWDLNAGPPRVERTILPTSGGFSAAAFSPRDASLLAAGEASGQLLLLDTRRPSPVVAAGPPARPRLVDLAWVQSKAGTEVMVCTAEGRVEWWDTRQLGEGPLDALDLAPPVETRGSGRAPPPGPAAVPTVLEYSSASGPTRFLAGTVRGAVLAGNRKGKSPADRISAAFKGHHGPITALQRHPAFPKYFLSAGDLSLRVWSEDAAHALLQTPCAQGAAYVTGAAWSPHRPALAFALGAGGTLSAWDWVQSAAEPAAELALARCALRGIAFPPGNAYQSLLAVGDDAGTTHLVKLSEGLAYAAASEKAATSALLERASGREKYLERAAREMKLRGRKGDAQPALAQLDADAGWSPEQEAQVEAEFLAAVAGGMSGASSQPLTSPGSRGGVHSHGHPGFHLPGTDDPALDAEAASPGGGGRQFFSADDQQHLRGQLPSLLPSPPRRFGGGTLSQSSSAPQSPWGPPPAQPMASRPASGEGYHPVAAPVVPAEGAAVQYPGQPEGWYQPAAQTGWEDGYAAPEDQSWAAHGYEPAGLAGAPEGQAYQPEYQATAEDPSWGQAAGEHQYYNAPYDQTATEGWEAGHDQSAWLPDQQGGQQAQGWDTTAQDAYGAHVTLPMPPPPRSTDSPIRAVFCRGVRPSEGGAAPGPSRIPRPGAGKDVLSPRGAPDATFGRKKRGVKSVLSSLGWHLTLLLLAALLAPELAVFSASSALGAARAGREALTRASLPDLRRMPRLAGWRHEGAPASAAAHGDRVLGVWSDMGRTLAEEFRVEPCRADEHVAACRLRQTGSLAWRLGRDAARGATATARGLQPVVWEWARKRPRVAASFLVVLRDWVHCLSIKKEGHACARAAFGGHGLAPPEGALDASGAEAERVLSAEESGDPGAGDEMTEHKVLAGGLDARRAAEAPDAETIAEPLAPADESPAAEAIEPEVEAAAPDTEAIEPEVEAAAPVAEAIAPAIEEAAPDTEVIAPEVEGAAPASEVAAPAIEDVTPVAEAIEPADEGAAPVAEAALPAIKDAAAPVAEAAVPATEVAAPVAELIGPAAESDVPIDEALAPDVENECPLAETLAPTAESAAPAVELAAPADESTAPAVELAAPAVEPEAPIAEALTPAVESEALELTDKNATKTAEPAAPASGLGPEFERQVCHDKDSCLGTEDSPVASESDTDEEGASPTVSELDTEASKPDQGEASKPAQGIAKAGMAPAAELAEPSEGLCLDQGETASCAAGPASEDGLDDADLAAEAAGMAPAEEAGQQTAHEPAEEEAAAEGAIAPETEAGIIEGEHPAPAPELDAVQPSLEPETEAPAPATETSAPAPGTKELAWEEGVPESRFAAEQAADQGQTEEAGGLDADRSVRGKPTPSWVASLLDKRHLSTTARRLEAWVEAQRAAYGQLLVPALAALVVVALGGAAVVLLLLRPRLLLRSPGVAMLVEEDVQMDSSAEEEATAAADSALTDEDQFSVSRSAAPSGVSGRLAAATASASSLLTSALRRGRAADDAGEISSHARGGRGGRTRRATAEVATPRRRPVTDRSSQISVPSPSIHSMVTRHSQRSKLEDVLADDDEVTPAPRRRRASRLHEAR
ncbi:hypothetical protein QBZ16_002734 [Prototheca wickerhamii]|uniref:Uncharacterized protein n=1 Tax=Prototheca wickerhamii TaxID=3111 RepID=A0AAD9IKW1_PROWI|nr:hypothetical protein QBZ16_002734 [Prototheca wickerhamii]